MKKILVIGNWKTYIGTRDEASKLVRSVKKLTVLHQWCDIVIAPSFPHILVAAVALKQTSVRVGAQAVSAHAGGARTGDVSAVTLKDAGASLVIVGHSERRAIGETSEIISMQLCNVVHNGLHAVLCVGELERDTESCSYFEYIKEQLNSSLAGATQKDAAKITIAYEPVWAIGKNGNDAVSPTELREVVIFIRKSLVEIFGRIAALKVPIIYGGSVDSYNVAELFAEGGVHGFLVGRASADAKKFSELLVALDLTQVSEVQKKK